MDDKSVRYPAMLSMVSTWIATPAFSAAPSIGLFGSFFPSWLICLFIGVGVTIVFRLIFVLIGLDDIIPLRIPVYMSMALGLSYFFSFLLFAR